MNKKKRQKLLSRAAGSVLDVGCGHGNNCHFMISKLLMSQ